MDVVDRFGTVLPGAVEQTVQPGDVLVREGDMDDNVFEVVEGTFEILRGAHWTRIDHVGPGDDDRARSPQSPSARGRPRSGSSAGHRSTDRP